MLRDAMRWQRVVEQVVVVSLITGLGVLLAPLRSEARDCSQTSVGLIPLNDLGSGTYQGQQGGLYPGGSNNRPMSHDVAGLGVTSQIQPLNAAGSQSDFCARSGKGLCKVTPKA